MLVVTHGADGPGALQVLIKAPIVVPDLEGCSPLQPRNQQRPKIERMPYCGKTKLASIQSGSDCLENQPTDPAAAGRYASYL